MSDALDLEALVKRYLNTVAAGSAADVAALYAEDATLEDPVGGGEVHIGRQAIEGFYKVVEGAGLAAELLTFRAGGHEAAFVFALTVGGAMRMNAGAMGSATFDAVESARLMDFDGTLRELLPQEMSVEYRGCATLKHHVALGAVLRGRPDSVESIAQRMSAFSQKRWSSQPAAPSAGCMFKNPATIPAGKLIDELGLKGARVGGARVSQEHGNFLVNDGNATAADVLELIGILQAKAQAERGIELRTEVEIIGERH